MDIFTPLAAVRLIFILGIINLVTGLLILLSCRCIPGWKLTSKLMKYEVYKRFFQYHCYIWWVFWASVIIHGILVIIFLGWPA